MVYREEANQWKHFPAGDEIIFIHTCDIIFDHSARNILACCQALVAAYDTNKQLIASLCSQRIIETLVFEIKNKE